MESSQTKQPNCCRRSTLLHPYVKLCFWNILVIPCCLSNYFLSHAWGCYKPVNTMGKAAVIPDPKGTPNVWSHMPCVTVPRLSLLREPRVKPVIVQLCFASLSLWAQRTRSGLLPCKPECAAVCSSVRHYDEDQSGSSVWRPCKSSLLTYDELDSGFEWL